MWRYVTLSETRGENIGGEWNCHQLVQDITKFNKKKRILRSDRGRQSGSAFSPACYRSEHVAHYLIGKNKQLLLTAPCCMVLVQESLAMRQSMHIGRPISIPGEWEWGAPFWARDAIAHSTDTFVTRACSLFVAIIGWIGQLRKLHCRLCWTSKWLRCTLPEGIL